MPEIIQETNVNSLALLLLGVVMLAVLFSTRENAVRALLLEALLVPLGQQFVLFGLHLRFFRLLILVGFFRILTRGEAKDFKATSLDKLILFWALVCLACGVLRGPKLETFGIAYDAVGT